MEYNDISLALKSIKNIVGRSTSKIALPTRIKEDIPKEFIEAFGPDLGPIKWQAYIESYLEILLCLNSTGTTWPAQSYFDYLHREFEKSYASMRFIAEKKANKNFIEQANSQARKIGKRR